MKPNNKALVYMRNRIIEQLHDSVEMYNQGDKAHVLDLLNRIRNTKGYSLNLSCMDTFYVRGTKYENVKHIKIREEFEGFEIVIHKIGGMIGYDCDHYMLMTNEELKQQAEDEIEGERRMSLWACGYRDF